MLLKVNTKNIKAEETKKKKKELSVKQFFYEIMPYLHDMINNHKATENGKFNYFISFKDTGETRTIYVWSDNEKILIGNKIDNIINYLFKSFLDNYQKEQQIMRKGSEFSFESVELLDYHLHKIISERGKSYIKPPKWLENKKATIIPKNYANNCFQYAITVTLNHQNIENHPERISNIKPFIKEYNWKDIDFHAHQKEDWEKVRKKYIMAIEWKKFEQNNMAIAPNVLFAPHNIKTKRLAYKSKYNHKRKNQVFLLMITEGKK